jgi:polyisoprenoid-binding protein YceI
MKRLMLGLAAAALTAGPATAETFPLTGENTKIEFVGTKPEGKHEGGFKTLAGKASVGADGLAIEVEIDLNSLWSDDPKLTGHLKSPDFFGVKANPKATFKTTGVKKAADGVEITGELTLNGKTKPVTFPAKVAASGDAFQLSSEFKIDRNDWGISYGKGKIDDAVTLRVSVNAKK